MIKYYNSMVVFEELPDEITLAINITNCPCKCIGCHSKFLWEDIGSELTIDELEKLIKKNSGITAVCFMGGDADVNGIINLSSFLKEKYTNIKVGWYSGRDKLPANIDYCKTFDYIKIGHYDGELGGLNKETTNQRLYLVTKEAINENFDKCHLIDITHKFWKKK